MVWETVFSILMFLTSLEAIFALFEKQFSLFSLSLLRRRRTDESLEIHLRTMMGHWLACGSWILPQPFTTGHEL